MSDFVRRLDLEKAVEERYGVNVEVYFKYINSNDYEIKIILGSKEALLHEHMRGGMTKHTTLTTDKAVTYKRYNEAEEDAFEYLRS